MTAALQTIDRHPDMTFESTGLTVHDGGSNCLES
jgi:hypothetical protein